MRRTLLGALAALLVGLAPSTALWAADVEPEQLRRGLIVTYRDNAKPTPAEVIQLDATIALALKVSEAAHPRLSADGGTVVWQGYINIVRGGTYRFTTKNLHGEFKLKIGDKLVFAASQKGPDRADKAGEEVQLEAGVQPLTAEFTRVPGIAW